MLYTERMALTEINRICGNVGYGQECTDRERSKKFACWTWTGFKALTEIAGSRECACTRMLDTSKNHRTDRERQSMNKLKYDVELFA